jgi:glycosyltransferase involved in cell wall biosynthesis
MRSIPDQALTMTDKQRRLLRGAYVAKVELDARHLAGVAAKVRAQLGVLRSLPAEVRAIHLVGAGTAVDGALLTTLSGRWKRRLNRYLAFYRTAATQLGELDFLYLRYQGCSPMLLWFLWRLRRRNREARIIVEVPTYPPQKRALTTRTLVLDATDACTRPFLKRFVDRIVTFSKFEKIFGIQTIRIDNGIDLDAVRLKTSSPPVDGIRLIGVANLSYWHGYDRVIDGIASYLRNGGGRDVVFDVVGEGEELPRLKALASKCGVTANIHFHGPVVGAALDDLMSRANIGISCIGMHRIVSDTSSLKSREYCARGLPFVLGHADRDFGPALPFVFHAPANDAPLDVAALAAWYDGLRADQPDYPAAMRAYAEQRLGWATKMQPVLDYLDQTTGAAR